MIGPEGKCHLTAWWNLPQIQHELPRVEDTEANPANMACTQLMSLQPGLLAGPQERGGSKFEFPERPEKNDKRTPQQGSLKDTFCNHLKHGFFNTKIKGNHHVQGNVEVYSARIPAQAHATWFSMADWWRQNARTPHALSLPGPF